MKEIVAEYPLVLAEGGPNTALYRFPSKNFKPGEIRYKPLSGYTEIKMSFPQKNTSALRIKLLNSTHLVYRSIPSPSPNYYHVKVEDGRIALAKIQSFYLFEPMHQYYPVSAHGPVLKKAESREELEHRKKSINYKLRNLDVEEARTMQYEDASALFRNRILVPGQEGACAGSAAGHSVGDLDASRSKHSVGDLDTSREKHPVLASDGKIEEVIRNARIANLSDLVAIFGDENAVRNALFKMTEKISGRFILKNIYYEKRLWEHRTDLLDLFRASGGEIPVSAARFLECEAWMVHEIAEQKDARYVLRGFRESTDFDVSAIESRYRQAIRRVLEAHRMLGIKEIGRQTSIDEEIIHRQITGPGYLHLINNAYALDSDSYWFNAVLKAFTAQKSLDIAEIRSHLEPSGVQYDDKAVVQELKHYCNQRGGRYFLKIIKE